MTEATFLALPIGLLIGLTLGSVGGGGSILAVPMLVYLLDQPVRAATTESLLIVGSTAAIGAAAAWRRGGVQLPIAGAFAVTGSAGALLGTAFNRHASPQLILGLFAVLLLVVAFLMRGHSEPPHRDTATKPGINAATLVAGGGIGLLTGFFGVGGGFVIVPVLTLLVGIPLVDAIGTSLLVIALTSGVALAAHAASGSVNWSLAIVCAGASVAGLVGSGRLTSDITVERRSQIFTLVSVAAALVLLGEIILAGA